MNSPLYALAQRFAEGGDVSYVTGKDGPVAVPGGIQQGMAIAGYTQPRQLSGRNLRNYLSGNKGVDYSGYEIPYNVRRQAFQNFLSRNAAMDARRAQMRQPQVQQRQVFVQPQVQPQPAPVAAPTPMPTLQSSPYQMPSGGNAAGWYSQPVQQYAQGGAVHGDSQIMNALLEMGYDPYA